ncbi:MAG TPA: hypothetical protein VNS58_06010 [Puia sp.]|nr:hypothetical protein [Puia sp.]
MFTEIKILLQKDRKLSILLSIGLLVQVVISITAIGIYHPDQHFQLIEFSSFQLQQESAAKSVWELQAQIRPSLQVYLFSAYYLFCEGCGIHSPFMQLTILRILLGLVLFVFFNSITLYYLKNERPRIIYWSLLILNFSWLLPYTRTLFSSEMLSPLFFFSGVFLYDWKRDRSIFTPLLTGFLFSLAFYFRFQMAFAILGFLVWMFLFERTGKGFLLLGLAFLAGMAINTCLDHGFYHQWVFTPYKYYEVNILQGKAASMGTASFLVYIGLLVLVITAPPLSILLLYYGVKEAVRKYNQPLFIAVSFFIIGHCLISHKEERFLFPVLNILPVLIGWGLSGFADYYQQCKRWVARLIKAILVFSGALNCIVLCLLFFTPYSQMIHFSSLLNDRFKDPVTIYCVPRTPFETESGLPLVFYRRALPNFTFKKIATNDSIRYVGTDKTGNTYLATTYNQVLDNLPMIDSLGYKPFVYSSALLWHLNGFLHSIGINTINDIWVLYKK